MESCGKIGTILYIYIVSTGFRNIFHIYTMWCENIVQTLGEYCLLMPHIVFQYQHYGALIYGLCIQCCSNDIDPMFTEY